MTEAEPGPEGAGPHQPLPIAPSLRRAQRFSASRVAERLEAQPRWKARWGAGTEPPQHQEEEEEEEEEHGGGVRLGVKRPPATGAHGEDGALSSAGHSPRPGDGQCTQAPGSPGGKEGGFWGPRADGRRARGFGPGQLLHNRAGLQAGASSPSPACLPSSGSLRPHQPPPVFLGRAPASRNACSCHAGPAAVRRCFLYRGSLLLRDPFFTASPACPSPCKEPLSSAALPA